MTSPTSGILLRCSVLYCLTDFIGGYSVRTVFDRSQLYSASAGCTHEIVGRGLRMVPHPLDGPFFKSSLNLQHENVGFGTASSRASRQPISWHPRCDGSNRTLLIGPGAGGYLLQPSPGALSTVHGARRAVCGVVFCVVFVRGQEQTLVLLALSACSCKTKLDAIAAGRFC